MADLADLAQVNEERLTKYIEKKPEGPGATGYCLSCGQLLDDKRWCDADCRDDWEKYYGKS